MPVNIPGIIAESNQTKHLNTCWDESWPVIQETKCFKNKGKEMELPSESSRNTSLKQEL